MAEANRLRRTVEWINRLPAPVRGRSLSLLVGRMVPFVGTVGVRVLEMTPERVVVSVRNRRKVQNHIRGVHATCMALMAETASGFVFGMNLPDDKLPLIKSIGMQYKHRSRGNMRAVATLPAEVLSRMQNDDKGEVSVPVSLEDESDRPPVVAEMIWAWVPRKKVPDSNQS